LQLLLATAPGNELKIAKYGFSGTVLVGSVHLTKF
jgi:hypothetical protein